MAKFFPFPSIAGFKDTIYATTATAQFSGFDESGKPIYDSTITLPVEAFSGTVKVHGTNAGIGYNPASNTLWAQSRNHVLSDKSDNCGFNTFVVNNKAYLISILSRLSSDKPIVAFGEWFGKGIQKNVAVDKLQRRLMVFAVKIIDDERDPTWLGKDAIELFYSPEHFIWNVYTFPVYEITIDFNDPKASQNKLVEITNQVEKECPVGKYFGVSGIGEGVVWSSKTYGRFKVKGDEHSSSKVTTLASVDTEKIASIDEFVKYAATENRFRQGIEQVFTIYGQKPDVKQTKKFITWVTNDIFKEESMTLTENNLIPEDVSKAIATAAREFLKHYL
jgi:hypothetical protein